MIWGKDLKKKIETDLKIAKYRRSLEKEVERQKLFQKKYPYFGASHKSQEKSVQRNLNIFNSLFGDK